MDEAQTAEHVVKKYYCVFFRGWLILSCNLILESIQVIWHVVEHKKCEFKRLIRVPIWLVTRKNDVMQLGREYVVLHRWKLAKNVDLDHNLLGLVGVLAQVQQHLDGHNLPWGQTPSLHYFPESPSPQTFQQLIPISNNFPNRLPKNQLLLETATRGALAFRRWYCGEVWGFEQGCRGFWWDLRWDLSLLDLLRFHIRQYF